MKLRASCLALLLLLAAGQAAEPGWTIQTVDSAGDVGYFTSLALDASGNPRISYWDQANGDLKYAAWNLQTVDSAGNVGQFTSLALDSSGNPRISYRDNTNFDLKYAAWNGSAWNIQTVDSAGDVGYSSSLALDASGNPHISYNDYTNKDLKYAAWNGSAWDIQTVDSAGNVGYYTSLALDASGNPRISYTDSTNGDLKYAAFSAVPILTTTPGDGGTLNFGYVLVGSSANRELAAANTGDPGSTLTGDMPAGSGEFTPGATQGFSLAQGASANRTYTYSPTGRGADSLAVTVTSDGGNSTVTLSGQGVAPVQSVDASAADAGLVRIGTTGTARVTVSNTGDGNLSGAGAASNLQGTIAAGSGKFSGAGGAISLADGGGQTFNYTYAPTTHTADSLTLAVDFANGNADGSNSAQTVEVQLAGQGVGPVFSSDPLSGSTLDFGAVLRGQTKSLALHLSNASTDPDGGNAALTDLTLISANIGGADAALFDLLGFTPGTVLHEGQTLDLLVEFDSQGDLGSKLAEVTFLTDQGEALGADGESFVFELTGLAADVVAPEPGDLTLLFLGGLCCLGRRQWKRYRARA